MPSKNSPGYSEWLRNYHLKRKKKPEEVAGQKQVQLFDDKPVVPVPAALPKSQFKSKQVVEVYSKSQDKWLSASIIRRHENGKWMVKREDGRFLYYGDDQLRPVAQAQSLDLTGEGGHIVPVGSVSFTIEKRLEPAVKAIQPLRIDLKAAGEYKSSLKALIFYNNEKIVAKVGTDSPQDIGAFIEKEGFRLPRTKENRISLDKDGLSEAASRGSEVAKLYAEQKSAEAKYRILNNVLTKMKDGEVSSTWDQYGASHGRITSSEPNLQQIPDEMRHIFIANSGFKLVSIDFSQMEYRVFASLSGDKNLKEAYEKGTVDFHTAVAAKILGKDPKDITEKERSKGKLINLALLYGMGPTALAKNAGITVQEASKFIENHKKEFPIANAWINHTKELLQGESHSKTYFGRKRAVPEGPRGIESAFNSIVSGTASDIYKMKLADAYQEIVSKMPEDIRIVNSLHDEILFEIKSDKVAEITPKLKSIMERKINDDFVPFRVDISTGNNWQGLSEWQV